MYFKVDDKTFFSLSGLYDTKQLDFAIFMWGSVFSPRFQTPLSEKFDRRGRKIPQLPLLQDGWKP
jgi:hypothetical protein